MKVNIINIMDVLMPSIEPEEASDDYEPYLVITKTNGDIISTGAVCVLGSKAKCMTECLPTHMAEHLENVATDGLIIDACDIANVEGRAMPIMAFS